MSVETKQIRPNMILKKQDPTDIWSFTIYSNSHVLIYEDKQPLFNLI